MSTDSPVQATVVHPAPEMPTYFYPETLKRLADPDELSKFINKTLKLSDRDFNAVLHDIGYRVVSWHQRAGALRGDVRLVQACEIYLKRAQSCLEQHARPSNDAGLETPFSRPARNPDPK